MTIKINISQQVLGGNLFNEDGYNVRASAYNYAAQCETEFRAAAKSRYPGAIVTVRADVEPNASGARRATTALITDGDGLVADDMSDELGDIESSVYQTFDWAVAE